MDIVKSPQSCIEDYLYNDFNINIYELLTESNSYTNIFEPLSFLNQLYADFEFFENNYQYYLQIKHYFNSLDISDIQKVFYFTHFKNLIDIIFPSVNPSDGVIYNSIEVIYKLHHKYCMADGAKFVTASEENKYDFDIVKQTISNIIEPREKINYLVEIIANYNQEPNKEFNELFEYWSRTFVQQCESEIIKLKNNILSESVHSKKKEQVTAIIPEQVFKPQLGNFTNSQIVLIFFYFFRYNNLELRADIDIAPIAKFIHLILGKEIKMLSSSEIYKKLLKAPNFKTDKELTKDLQAIKPLFYAVQLNEIVKMIDNEIAIAIKESKS